ncbi:MAG: 50S ribosomal protein L29 [Candidatus Aminicenantes bacterium]|jgi:large subunit ribosomal protein L29|nr:50S ribosomal protein L29 [Candidatus Aminicenantes bacterium]
MKARELKELTEDELQQKEKELTDQLFKLRFQHALGQVENAMKLRNIRRDLARIKTILKDKGKGRRKD